MALDYRKREKDTEDLVNVIQTIFPDYAADFIHSNFEHLIALRAVGMEGFVVNVLHDSAFTEAIVKAIDMDLNDELIANISKISTQLVFTINEDWVDRESNEPPYVADTQVELMYNNEYIQPIIQSSEGTTDEIQSIWLADVLAACVTNDTANPTMSFTMYECGDGSDEGMPDCACDCCDHA